LLEEGPLQNAAGILEGALFIVCGIMASKRAHEIHERGWALRFRSGLVKAAQRPRRLVDRPTVS